MKNIEEELWNYIDGNCTAGEQQAIAALIISNEVYRQKYDELLKLNQEFNMMELEEPSMAFTYHVMEAIRTENAQKPLKAAVNKRIILGIAAFFIVTIAALLIFVIGSADWSTVQGSGYKIQVPAQLTVNAAHMNSYFTGPVVKGFLFLDLVAGLFLLDSYLRRKIVLNQQ